MCQIIDSLYGLYQCYLERILSNGYFIFLLRYPIDGTGNNNGLICMEFGRHQTANLPTFRLHK